MVQLDWSNIPKDLCPVCKTDKYLSPSLQFKINPECYHKICDSCVDRIFSLGPSPCPYPNCGKILRRNKFKTQVFEDIEVERECDVRRKVMSVYNKKEEDFATLDAHNAYLEEIEDFVYKLLNKIDIEETEEKLKEYSIQNKQAIELNNSRKDQEYEKFIRTQNLEKRFKQERNKINRLIIKEEQNLKNLSKMAIIDQLQNSSGEKDPDKIIAKVKATMLLETNKHRKQLQELEAKYEQQKQMLFRSGTLQEKEQVEEVVIPFTPFNGDRMAQPPYKFIETNYKDPYMMKLVDNVQYKAGGYKLQSYFERSLNGAFTGLDCIVEEEKSF
ncbi:hypothetical protein CANARDRAFT_6624 [[Candida] arabinofermentans NRRL YB-2248]|uniref:RNA polymerase II transcription factor B subunit 3 n=1 Tax=[Candida] arabinofermentans NRRL YB-2248 TaxID=983967 RepID=A0A1E4T2Z0_9ASCO|nr:hypothetical protein CANARDRAFT_6624 [[Candida] arabinofermentans NRRL YB-2248]